MASRKAGRRRPDASTPTGSRARRRSCLAFLSPRIQAAILDGTAPKGLTLERLLARKTPERRGIPGETGARRQRLG
jgi:hypothetical protein